ncbi:ras-related protein Rab-23 isoform X4 [Mustela erminea]|nr:ras-related protein Rab-23 isoform X4 [Mustela erminea]
MLWDTAGQEEFDAITKAYYRGAQACVLVFSTTDRESFEAISSWREKVVAEVGDIPTVLVQNKIDLLDDSCIKNEEAEALAKKLKLRFYRTSVKEDLNVTEVFKYLAEKYLQKLKQQIAEDPELMHSSSNKIVAIIGPSLEPSVDSWVSFMTLKVSLIHLLEVTRVRIQVPLMVEMSSILDPTNRGPRKTEILLAAVAYPKTL